MSRSVKPRHERSQVSQLRWTGIFIAVGILSACARGGPLQREWTEDVKLDGGSAVEVRRSVTLKVSNSLSGDAYNAEELGATLSFSGSLSQLPAWSAPRMALVLYRDVTTQEWVIVATTTSCEVWQREGKPKPAYWEYRLKPQGWQEVPLSSASIGRRANLFFGYDHRLKSAHVTAADTERVDHDPTNGSKYRKISGDPDMYICGEGNPGKR